MGALIEPEQSKPADRAWRDLPRTPELAVCAALGICGAAVWALGVGKGIVWDQKNYYYYNVYAWLNGRMDYHVAPAGMHSWLNPIAYLPQYCVLHVFPPIMAGLTFAAWQGLNFVLVYGLSRLVLQGCSKWPAAVVAFTCAIVGLCDPLLVAQIGTSGSDYLVTLPVLAALYAVCWAMGPIHSNKQKDAAYGISGILLGAAAGLKWTCFIYAAGMTAVLLALWPLLGMRPRRFIFYSVGGILGFLPTGGIWSWILWTRYGNPILPYWNNLFRSPWMAALPYRDMRFLPHTLSTAISYPFQWLIGLHPTTEGNMRDGRFAVLAVLMPMVFAVLLGLGMARLRGRPSETVEHGALAARDRRWFLLAFASVSYVLWMAIFSFQRYLSPVSLLTGLLVVLALDFLVSDRTIKIAGFFLVAVFSCFWMRPETSVIRVPYGKDWFGIHLPAEAEEPGTLFVMLGPGPMGYVVPFLPASSRTVRFIDSTIPENGTETLLVRRAREIIAEHSGPIRSLSIEPLKEVDFEYLRRFGLRMNQEGCRVFRTDGDQFTSCTISKQTDSALTTSLPRIR